MTYIIGDVHGCYYTLRKLISKIPKKAKIIFVGDLCDKGNFTKEVINLIRNEGYLSVKGNHEIFMETYLKDSVFNDKNTLWGTSKTFGGSKTIKSYINESSLIDEDISFIEKFPLYLIIDNYFITHGFGLPYFNRRDTHFKALVSNRVERPYADWDNYSELEIINVFGHTSFDNVLRDKQFFGIDTGCVYGNKLTAFELETHRIIEEMVDPRDIS